MPIFSKIGFRTVTTNISSHLYLLGNVLFPNCEFQKVSKATPRRNSTQLFSLFYVEI